MAEVHGVINGTQVSQRLISVQQASSAKVQQQSRLRYSLAKVYVAERGSGESRRGDWQ